jgi:hypothetical protein
MERRLFPVLTSFFEIMEALGERVRQMERETDVGCWCGLGSHE